MTHRWMADGGPPLAYPPTLWGLLKEAGLSDRTGPVLADDYGRSLTSRSCTEQPRASLPDSSVVGSDPIPSCRGSCPP